MGASTPHGEMADRVLTAWKRRLFYLGKLLFPCPLVKRLPAST